MNTWFQCRVKYMQQTQEGLARSVSEQYLVDAMSFTEAENRIILELGESQKELTMMSVARSNIREVVMYGDTEKFFKAKVTYSTIEGDEGGEKEKKVTTYLLVNADNVRDAYDRVQEHLKAMMVPFQVPKIEDSPIKEVYPYVAGLRAGLTRVDENPGEEEQF